MPEAMDTKVYGDAAEAQTAADACTTAKDAVGDALDDLGKAIKTAGSWKGQAGAAFESKAEKRKSDLRQLESRIEAMGKGLSTFSGDLKAVETKMSTIRTEASGAGLTVSGTMISPPTDPGEDASEGDVNAHNTKVEKWNDLVSRVETARKDEDNAHEDLGKAISKSTGDGWIEDRLEDLGLLPKDFSDGMQIGAYALGLAGLGAGAGVDWMVKSRYGTFQPRVNGRFASPSSLTKLERAAKVLSDKNWHAKANQAAVRGKWLTAGKWATRAGWVVTAGTSAWEQWQKDADDPSLSTTERVSRTVSTSAITTAGAAGGAWAGAQAGAAIGSIFPGPGTVIGGVVGGVIGGAIGSGLAGKAADFVVDEAGELGEAVVDGVSDFAEGAGEVASDVGDAITFWD